MNSANFGGYNLSRFRQESGIKNMITLEAKSIQDTTELIFITLILD